MPSGASISIILCTHNRTQSLLQSLAALGRVVIPPGWKAEVIVVDNASTDDTAQVMRQAALPNMEVRYLYEGRKGKSHALNTAVTQARGEFLLFTDDDVHPAEDWLTQMVAPLLDHQCDAVTGQLLLAPSLLRDWMTPMHKMWLALSLDSQSRDWSREVIGAHQGIRRSVLEVVPGWDPELGPGPEALGFCEDTLFGWQMAEAGFRIRHLPQAIAIHHLDATRLQRAAWLSDAVKRGQTEAYLRHHWQHLAVRLPRLRWTWYWLKLRLRRIIQPPAPLDSEGCPNWEMSYVFQMEMCRQFCRERRRPRNYERRGLRKRPAAARSSPP